MARLRIPAEQVRCGDRLDIPRVGTFIVSAQIGPCGGNQRIEIEGRLPFGNRSPYVVLFRHRGDPVEVIRG